MLPECGERGAFEFEVGVRVTARGHDAGMAEIVADDGEVDTGLEQSAGAAMAQGVRRYS